MLLLSWSNNVVAQDQQTLVTINQIVSHPALDDARHGIQDAFIHRRMLAGRIKLKIDNAHGSIATAVQIAKLHASLKPKFMIAIATPSAQAVLKARDPKRTTLAFLAVTDPQSAGLTDMQNVIGVSDNPPVEELLKNLVQVMPKIKTIGVVYNAGEINSVSTIKRLTAAAESSNLNVKSVTISSTRDITPSVSKLVQQVDVIYIPQDNLVVSGLNSLLTITNKNKIPVINNDPCLLSKGLFLSLGSDYYKSGFLLGEMISDLIDGKDISPNIQTSQDNTLKINSYATQLLDISIPPKFKSNVLTFFK
jgi:putative ABC transport system substrate-binding protein